eukprot:2986656-Rhodomonas_salina.2
MPRGLHHREVDVLPVRQQETFVRLYPSSALPQRAVPRGVAPEKGRHQLHKRARLRPREEDVGQQRMRGLHDPHHVAHVCNGTLNKVLQREQHRVWHAGGHARDGAPEDTRAQPLDLERAHVHVRAVRRYERATGLCCRVPVPILEDQRSELIVHVAIVGPEKVCSRNREQTPSRRDDVAQRVQQLVADDMCTTGLNKRADHLCGLQDRTRHDRERAHREHEAAAALNI